MKVWTVRENDYDTYVDAVVASPEAALAYLEAEHPGSHGVLEPYGLEDLYTVMLKFPNGTGREFAIVPYELLGGS